jgi:lipid A 3-O-deacylase
MMSHTHPAPLVLAMTAALGLAVAAQAQSERRWPACQLQWENDAFAIARGSDEHYTNGLRFSMVKNPEFNRDWQEDFADWWREKIFSGPADAFFGLALGQSIYTPDDLSIPTLIVDDRPYAALLYGSLFANFLNDQQTAQQTIELKIGIVGPEAGGEQAQREVHELIDDEPPLGWDNQLALEPVLNLDFQLARRLVLAGEKSAARVDFVPHWGLGLGTIMTRASGGGTLRLGKNISGFPQFDIGDTVGGARTDSFGGGIDEDRARFEGYLFFGVEARAVLHNLFLDGNLFKSSHRVDKRNEVMDLRAGFFVRFKSWQLNYTFVRRSAEFDPPRGRHGGRHDFGSVTVSRVLPLK